MLMVITGGSGSGKSAYAEQAVKEFGERERIYVATMKPWDEECRLRIRRHRAMRAKKRFQTVEHYRDLELLDLPGNRKERVILLECVSNLVSNQLFGTVTEEFTAAYPPAAAKRAAASVMKGILHLNGQAGDLVVVTNEVFSDGDYRALRGRSAMNFAALYLKTLGEVNLRLGARADQVIEVTAGIPIFIKRGNV